MDKNKKHNMGRIKESKHLLFKMSSVQVKRERGGNLYVAFANPALEQLSGAHFNHN